MSEPICRTCEYKDLCKMCDLGKSDTAITACYEYKEQLKKTNADRIRSMTDEELTYWLVEVQLEMYKCVIQGKIPKEYPFTDGGWLEWLKQEVAE